jgi:hypothetical protein
MQKVRIKQGAADQWWIFHPTNDALGWSGSTWVPCDPVLGFPTGDVQVCNFPTEKHAQDYVADLDFDAPMVLIEDRLGYQRAGEHVILTMSADDYKHVLMALSALTAPAIAGRYGFTVNTMLALVNRINEGNPDYTPYNVRAHES